MKNIFQITLFCIVVSYVAIAIPDGLSAQDFTELTGSPLRGVNWSSAAWGDYDNDGDLDILLAGQDSTIDDTTIIYRNNGDDTFTAQTGISLAGIAGGSAVWGDYDNDGDLDILLAGFSHGEVVSKVYSNGGNNSFTEQTGIFLTGVYMGTASWVDYDNDGNLDIFISGNTEWDFYNQARIVG